MPFKKSNGKYLQEVDVPEVMLATLGRELGNSGILKKQMEATANGNQLHGRETESCKTDQDEAGLEVNKLSTKYMSLREENVAITGFIWRSWWQEAARHARV